MADLLDIPWVRTLGALALLVTAVLLLHLVARRYVLLILGSIARRTRVEWDQEVFEHRVPHRATLVIPLIALELGLQLVPGLPPGLQILLHRLISATLVLIVALVTSAMLSVAHTLLDLMIRRVGRRVRGRRRHPAAPAKPHGKELIL